MDRRRKTILYIAGGTIGLIIIVLLLKTIVNSNFKSKIPEISDSQTLSQPVKEQISYALSKVHRNPSAENLGMLGMVYHSCADYERAAQCYELAIKKNKSGWIWNYYLGYLSIEMGESDAVMENFKRVIKNNKDINLAWYYMGEEYKNQRKYELAEESFSKITTQDDINSIPEKTTRLDHFPLSIYAMFQLSRIYSETGRLDFAEKTLKEIIQADRSFGPAYRLLGNVYSQKGEISLGEKYVVRAKDLVLFAPPVDTLIDKLALISRSELYLLKKIDEAEYSVYDRWTLRLVNHALQYLPDNKYLMSKAIKTYLWMNLVEQAIALTDQHIQYFQENITELNKTGNLFYLNGFYPQAIQYLTRASALEPEDVEIKKKLALSFWYVGDKQKSHEILDELYKENKDNPDVVADIATILLFNLGESEKAMQYLARSKQLAPSNPKGQKLSARIAERNGKIQEAIELYESSFRGDPEDITTIRYLGNLLTEQKIWDKSITHYRKALEYHPNDPYLLERLGTILVACPDLSLRNIEEGREYSERAFIHISSRPNTLVLSGRSLAIAYAMLGDKENAIETITEAINIGRHENISQSYLSELEDLYKTFQAMDK